VASAVNAAPGKDVKAVRAEPGAPSAARAARTRPKVHPAQLKPARIGPAAATGRNAVTALNAAIVETARNAPIATP